MKKLIVLFALLLSVGSAKAQNFKEDGGKYEVYCNVSYQPFGDRLHFIINNKKYVIIDKEGKEIKPKEETELLNLLAKRGWKLVSSSANENYYHYTMKKEINDDKEIEVGIATK